MKEDTMRKKYEKPIMLFESMEFSSAIAACKFVQIGPGVASSMELPPEWINLGISYHQQGLCFLTADDVNSEIYCYDNPDMSVNSQLINLS